MLQNIHTKGICHKIFDSFLISWLKNLAPWVLFRKDILENGVSESGQQKHGHGVRIVIETVSA